MRQPQASCLDVFAHELYSRAQTPIVTFIKRNESKRTRRRFLFFWWTQKLHQPLHRTGRRVQRQFREGHRADIAAKLRESAGHRKAPQGGRYQCVPEGELHGAVVSVVRHAYSGSTCLAVGMGEMGHDGTALHHISVIERLPTLRNARAIVRCAHWTDGQSFLALLRVRASASKIVHGRRDHKVNQAPSARGATIG
jgi:hypothetical protein